MAYLSSWTNIAQDATAITDYIWYHVAIVRNGNYVKMYRNGIEVSSYDITGKSLRKGTNILNIGCMYNGGAFPEIFYGQYFRITNGVARWTSNFTPPNKY